MLEQSELAILDPRVLARIAPWPQLLAALAGRSARRARWLSAQTLARRMRRVDDRLLLMLAVLAERHGRVRPDGTLVPLRLTHTLLGRMVGARRPSVTAALGRLRDLGVLSLTAEGWLLHGGTDAASLLEAARDRRDMACGAAAATGAAALAQQVAARAA